MKTKSFFSGFLIGLLAFILINILAAHLLSDCGLPAVIGADFCADDIARAGFPLVFYESGGFDGRNIFNPSFLLMDIFIGVGVAIFGGVVMLWKNKSVL